MKKECKNCLHFEVCAYAAPDLPIYDSFLSSVQNNYAKRFIVFTNEDWYARYNSEENLP